MTTPTLIFAQDARSIQSVPFLMRRRVIPSLRPYLQRNLIKPGERLRARCDGKTYYCWLQKDGRLKYLGQLFNSPSTAGCVIQCRPTNGWNFWHIQRGNRWVPLAIIRKGIKTSNAQLI